jgi:hypothetical protein
MQRLFGIVSLGIIFGLACSGDDDSPTDPDPGALPAMMVDDQTVVEGNTVLFPVSINRSTGHAVTFTFSTADGTAIAGSDYMSLTGSDTIPAGEIRTIVLVSTIDDSEDESPEYFTLILNSVAGASVSKSTATATINDNDISGVSFASEVQPLLRTSCSNLACHGNATHSSGMYLGTNANYADVIVARGDNTEIWLGGTDDKVVQSGDSEASTLYRKVDTTRAAPFASRMPSGASALSRAQQLLIRDWIDQGALDN